MNYFGTRVVGERYAKGRPFWQNVVMGQIRERLRVQGLLPRVLDVGCGTGNSTRALLDLATQVVGADASSGMLEAAPRLPGITYVQSSAETLPFADASFDLATVSSAFHWFDRERFLPEAWRVLHPSGALVIYTSGAKGTMRENPDYERWQRQVYHGRYPGTARHRQPVSDEDAAQAGFSAVVREQVGYDVSFTVDELARWFTTHSNIIAAIDRGDDTLDGIMSWLTTALTPLFPAPRCTFPFETTIAYLPKA